MLKFSVLMSVYKNEKPDYLREALESVVQQTVMPNEIVIVKDGLLTEELDAVINEYSEKYPALFKIVSFEKNRGLGLALRDGVLACSYEYIARMDTDDICKPNRFEKQIKYLEENPRTVLLGTWIKEFSKNRNNPDTITKLPCEHQEIVQFSKSRNPFRHMTVIFNKQAVLDSGNYRDFLWFEDYDLWVRIIQNGYEVANLPEFLVDVRADNDMFARRGGWKYLKQDLKFQRVLYDSGFISCFHFMKNVFVRSVVRVLPNDVRVWIYKGLLRKFNL
mgnify:CR=1 FL=1